VPVGRGPNFGGIFFQGASKKMLTKKKKSEKKVIEQEL
jgi:hypothetical protein